MSKTHKTHFTQTKEMPWKKKVHRINGRDYYLNKDGKYVPVHVRRQNLSDKPRGLGVETFQP